MHRHVIAHGDHSGLAVEDRAGIVAPLLDVRRKRGAAQRSAHLLGNRMHGALKDRQFDRIDGCRDSCALLSGNGDYEIADSRPPVHGNPAATPSPKCIR